MPAPYCPSLPIPSSLLFSGCAMFSKEYPDEHTPSNVSSAVTHSFISSRVGASKRISSPKARRVKDLKGTESSAPMEANTVLFEFPLESSGTNKLGNTCQISKPKILCSWTSGPMLPDKMTLLRAQLRRAKTWTLRAMPQESARYHARLPPCAVAKRIASATSISGKLRWVCRIAFWPVSAKSRIRATGLRQGSSSGSNRELESLVRKLLAQNL
mmetsp:Transcript_22917/g.55463  ORF Transcript_22917/g.55463 Transcript_22917/m.55463 type:complete len:214 (-) Transcript_22917:1144-1785(-)